MDLNKHDNKISAPNLRKGYLKKEQRLVKHHEAIEAVEEQGHWETVCEYPSGGKEVVWVVDVVGIEGKEAWDEYEDVESYVEYTHEELAELAKTPLTPYEKLLLFADSIEEEEYPSQPAPSGYMYQRIYSKSTDKIVWVLVEDID